MKRTTSSTMDTLGRRRPSPDSSRRPSPDSSSRLVSDLIAARSGLAGKSFVDKSDNKSKNILEWAGRVKELIGTYDHTPDPSMGQLTRATGYSNLLAACGVDSGDVKRSPTLSKPEKVDSTKLTKTRTTQPKPVTTPMLQQLSPDRDETGHFLTTYNKEQTKQHYLPLATSSTTSRSDEQDKRADIRREIRRAASTQGRLLHDLPDPSMKPPSRRSSQTEVKPPGIRESSRSPEARSQQRRSSVGEKAPSSADQTQTGGLPSRESGTEHQSRKQLGRRSSKEALLTSVAAKISKHIRTDEEGRRYADKTFTDVTGGATSGGTVASRGSYEHEAERPVPAIRNNLYASAEDRESYQPHRPRTSDSGEVGSTAQVASQRVRATDGDPQEGRVSRVEPTDHRHPQEGRVSRVEPTDHKHQLSRKSSDRDKDLERYRQSARTPPPPVNIEGKESIESLSQRLNDLSDMRRREQQPSQRPSDTSTTSSGSQGVRDTRDQDSSQQESSLEDKDSIENLSQRLSDLNDMRRRSEHSPPTRLPRDQPSPQRASAMPRAPDVEQAKSAQSRSRRVRENYQQEARVGRQPADLENKDSIESISQKVSDLDVQRTAEFSPRTRAPPHQVPDTSQVIDVRRDYHDLIDRRDRTPPVKSRRRLTSESERLKQQLVDSGSSSPAPRTSEGRKPKPRTSSAGPPSTRPILRKTPSPHPGVKAATEKARKLIAESQQKRSPSPPSAALARQPVVPLRRTAAATSASIAPKSDDSDDMFVEVIRHPGGRRLGKSVAVTDLSEDPDVIHMKRSDLKNAPVASSTSLTPRRVWHFMHPLLLNVRQLVASLLECTMQLLCAVFGLPPVAEVWHRMREMCLRVMDDWALFFAVVAVLLCTFIVIMMC